VKYMIHVKGGASYEGMGTSGLMSQWRTFVRS
jgi:hypothetical protein